MQKIISTGVFMCGIQISLLSLPLSKITHLLHCPSYLPSLQKSVPYYTPKENQTVFHADTGSARFDKATVLVKYKTFAPIILLPLWITPNILLPMQIMSRLRSSEIR